MPLIRMTLRAQRAYFSYTMAVLAGGAAYTILLRNQVAWELPTWQVWGGTALAYLIAKRLTRDAWDVCLLLLKGEMKKSVAYFKKRRQIGRGPDETD